MKTRLILAVCGILSLLGNIASAQKLEPSLYANIEADSLPTFTAEGKRVRIPAGEMVLEFGIKSGSSYVDIERNAVSVNPTNFQLTQVSGSKEKPVALNGGILRNTPRGASGKLYFRLAALPKEGAVFNLRLASPLSLTLPNGKRATFDGDNANPVSTGKGDTTGELQYGGLLGYQNHFKVGRAEKGTAVSFNFAAGKHVLNYNDGTWWGVDLRAKGDIGLDTKQREIYSDNWRAETSLYYHKGLFEQPDGNRIPTDFRIVGNFEGDKDFENIDGAIGANLRARVPFGFNKIYNILPTLFGTPVDGAEEAIAAPVFELGYHYNSKLEKDAASKDMGHQRIVGSFEWQMPVFRHVRFPLDALFSGAGDDFRINADIIFDVRALYHLDPEKITDESKITLLIRKDTLRDEKKDAKVPSFSLTYARGKATPTFENYDSIIAGFRFPF